MSGGPALFIGGPQDGRRQELCAPFPADYHFAVHPPVKFDWHAPRGWPYPAYKPTTVDYDLACVAVDTAIYVHRGHLKSTRPIDVLEYLAIHYQGA